MELGIARRVIRYLTVKCPRRASSFPRKRESRVQQTAFTAACRHVPTKPLNRHSRASGNPESSRRRSQPHADTSQRNLKVRAKESFERTRTERRRLRKSAETRANAMKTPRKERTTEAGVKPGQGYQLPCLWGGNHRPSPRRCYIMQYRTPRYPIKAGAPRPSQSR